MQLANTRFSGFFALAAGALALAGTAAAPAAQAQQDVQAVSQTVVTALPKSGETASTIPASALELKVDGKSVQPATWHPYGQGAVQLVLLIDDSLRTSIGIHLGEMASFINGLPPNVSIGVAYMQNGSAVFASPFSSNKATAAKALHLPGGSPGSNASPYFCLQDLAKRWPAPPSAARREVVMVTDGVDGYALRYDPENPYILSAIDAANRANLVVYSIYFRNQGFASSTFYETNAGQNYLTQVADATGGKLFYQGLTNPVSFTPFFDELTRRLNNQYELGVPVKSEKKVSYASLKVKTDIGGLKLDAANRIAISAAGSAPQ